MKLAGLILLGLLYIAGQIYAHPVPFVNNMRSGPQENAKLPHSLEGVVIPAEAVFAPGTLIQ